MSQSPVSVLNQVRLLVDDFPAVYRFYRDVVGLEPAYGDENEVYASFNTGPTAVALFRRDLMAQAIGQDIAAVGSGLGQAVVVIEVADVDAAWERVQAASDAGIAGPTDRPDWGIKTAQLRDPAGNIVELFVALEAGQ